jgi:hypothetical protein
MYRFSAGLGWETFADELIAGALIGFGGSWLRAAGGAAEKTSNRPVKHGKNLRTFKITLVTYARRFLSSRMRLSAQTCHLLVLSGVPGFGRGVRVRRSYSS